MATTEPPAGPDTVATSEPPDGPETVVTSEPQDGPDTVAMSEPFDGPDTVATPALTEAAHAAHAAHEARDLGATIVDSKPPSAIAAPDTVDPDSQETTPLEEAEMPAGALAMAPQRPVITQIRPARANASGGTPITVFGAGFAPGCRVFAGEDELIGEVVDAFCLRFVAPAREGRVVIEVEGPSGVRCPSGIDLEFVAGPKIHRVEPSEGPLEGGIEIAVHGENFVEGCALTLFGATAPEAKLEDEKTLRFMLPPAGDGPQHGPILVTNPDGLWGKAESGFRYRPLKPRIDSLEPARGWVNGGKLLTARGVDFHTKVRAWIGDRPAVVRFKSTQQIEIEVPPADAPGIVDVILENPDGFRPVLERAFTYEPVPAPPKIIDVLPRTGPTTGGPSIRLIGDNFTEDVRVRIGELTAMRKVLSAKLIDFILPAHELPGPVALEVSLDEVTIRIEEAFTYESPRAPKLTNVEPRSGPQSGGTKVVIEGENFPPNAAVFFNRVAAKSFAIKDATRIEAVTPASRSAGVVDVEVSSAQTGPGISKGGFRYEAVQAPLITSVAPNRGTIDGGTELTVEGKHFGEGVVVLMGGIAAKTKRISGSVLEVRSPGGDDGALVDVVVKNPDGQQAVQKRAFQYDARYRA